MTIATGIALAALSHIAYDLVKGLIRVFKKVHAKRMSKKAKNVEAKRARERKLAAMALKHDMTVEEFKAIFK